VSVKIRLARVGKKNYPVYRVVVADSRSPRNGKFIEIIGQYLPMQTPSAVTIDSEKAVKWLKEGAVPSDTAQKLLRQTGTWSEFDPKDEKPVSKKYLLKVEVSKTKSSKAKAEADEKAKLEADEAAAAKAEADKAATEAKEQAEAAKVEAATAAAAETPVEEPVAAEESK
jgi:small subunit ribosomal protein S16